MRSNIDKIYALADEAGNNGEAEFYIQGAVLGPKAEIDRVAEAYDEFNRAFPGAPSHISAGLDPHLRDASLEWVVNFVLAREVTFHATIIERSYFPVVLLTDIMFSAFAYMGVPMKALPGPCRDLIELTADRLAPPQLVEEFWELWTNTKWPDLDRLLRGVKIQDVADPFGSNLAHLLMLGAHGLSENRTMHRLHSDGVVDHLENSIAGRGIELLLRGLLARAKGRGLGFHHDRNDWLRDKWLKSRFPKTRYASEDVEITFGHDKSDKSRFFVVDALAWLLSKCVNQSFDAENSNHRIFRKVLGKPNFSIAEGAITRFNAKNTIDANWQIVKDHDVFSALLRDYRSSLNAS